MTVKIIQAQMAEHKITRERLFRAVAEDRRTKKSVKELTFANTAARKGYSVTPFSSSSSEKSRCGVVLSACSKSIPLGRLE
jgi:hypothetical protein